MRTDMDEYVKKAVARFKKDYAKTLQKVSSPYLTNEEIALPGPT